MDKSSEQKQTLYNIIASVLIGGINFLTAPIFTRLLGTAQYGKFSVAYSWVTILTCFMGFQTKEALATGIYDFREDYLRFRNSTLLLGTGISIGLIALLSAFSGPIGRALGYSPVFLFLILLTALTQYIWAFAQNTFIFEKKAQYNLLLSVFLVISIVALSIFFILYAPFEKYVGRMLGFTIPFAAFAFGCWIALFSRQPSGYHKTYWKYSLSFGFPIIFHALSTVVLGQSDRVMMQLFHVQDSDIGVYSWYFGLISALIMVRDALNNSWRPFYYDGLNENRCEPLNQKCGNLLELFTVITCVFLLIVREVSLLMAGKEYQRDLGVLLILVIGAYFTFVFQFPVNFELYHKKTKIIATGTVSAAMANVLLNAVLIPRWGVYGAAAATSAAYLLLAMAHFLIATHLRGIPYHLRLLSFLPGLIAITLGAVLFLILPQLWILRWLLAAVITAWELIRILKRKSVF